MVYQTIVYGRLAKQYTWVWELKLVTSGAVSYVVVFSINNFHKYGEVVLAITLHFIIINNQILTMAGTTPFACGSRTTRPERFQVKFPNPFLQCSGSGCVCFGPSGSAYGSVIYLYGSGFGLFHQQAQKFSKTLISTVLWLLFISEDWCKCTFQNE